MTSSPVATTRPRGLWIGVALGSPVIALAVIDALGDPGDTHPAELARWIVGGALVVDVVVVPIALGVGRVLSRRPALRWVRWPLASTATLGLVGWPFVRGYGRSADNPSLLPRDHGTGVLVAVAVVWVVAAVARFTTASRRGR